MNNKQLLFIEAYGAITGVIGAILLAFNFEYSKWGFVAFTFSSIFLGYFAWKKEMKYLLSMQAIFLIINFIGIYRWF